MNDSNNIVNFLYKYSYAKCHRFILAATNKGYYVQKILSILVVFTVNFTGCSAVRHGWTQANFEGFVVPITTKPGAFRLKIEADYDPTIQTYLQKNGYPDYIYVIDRNTVSLIYELKSQVVTFQRHFTSTGSKVSIQNNIPIHIKSQLN